MKTPGPIRSPHRPQPPPGGAILKTVHTPDALSPGDVCQPRRARTPAIARLEQPAVVVLRARFDALDFDARERLLEKLVDCPKDVSRCNLFLPDHDGRPHVLREPNVADDNDLI